MSKSYLCSFDELFKLLDDSDKRLINNIIIPIIQRDYAQGRLDSDVKRIRFNFLNSLCEAINGEGICLDFVYGNIDEERNLLPLDGQQRLTTLFLLYWYISKKEMIEKSNYEFLRNFSYQTRYSSRNFCEYLIDYSPDLSSNTSISEQIIDQAWFPLDWLNDPTIKSMLVMIDDISQKFKDLDNVWLQLTENKKIKFYFLPIKNMGLTDELYIKMNSRGKPLTQFEHFKAEFERQIELLNFEKANIINRKIDLEWTDLLWKFRNEKNSVDKMFLNYFRFICDIICYENNHTPQNRTYDEFDLIKIYFDGNIDNLDFLEKMFDCWNDYDEINNNVFDKYLSRVSQLGKVKITTRVNNQHNMLKDFLYDYYNEKTGRRGAAFSLPKLVLLYGIIQYLLNKNTITESQFIERFRIVNNLVQNSNDEMNDSENRVGGNRIPAILSQTKIIIINGTIEDNLAINFNSSQLDEEKEKIVWRASNPTLINLLNKLEDHDLLYGQVSIIGLDKVSLTDKFYELFNCNKDKISCALLTVNDYSRVEHGWKCGFGCSKNKSWEFLFHKSTAARYFDTKAVLVTLLESKANFNDSVLDEITQSFIDNCVSCRTYDWRYYFIRYEEFRPDTYGKYWFKSSNRYDLSCLWTEMKLSENAYQPFLKILDPAHLDREDCGKQLKYEDGKVYCEDSRFVKKDFSGNIISSLSINQNSNGIDIEDRIEKFRANPL